MRLACMTLEATIAIVKKREKSFKNSNSIRFFRNKIHFSLQSEFTHELAPTPGTIEINLRKNFGLLAIGGDDFTESVAAVAFIG